MPAFSDRLAAWTAPLLESRCASCAVPVAAGRNTFRPAQGPVLCPACETELARRTGGHCSRCGELAPQADSLPAPCAECLGTDRPWNAFFFHAAYQDRLRNMILRFKNGHELSLAHALGTLLASHPAITGPYDAIVPMPLHPRRLRERGFNQALELARPLAKKLGVPLEPRLLIRTGYTHTQAGLSLSERKRSVRGLFAANGVTGRRLLLLDDIATTCATLKSAAAALREAGAMSVDVAVVARTPRYAAG